MKLKVKLLRWSAGRPVVILNIKLAKRLNLHVDERIMLNKGPQKIIAVTDIASGLVKENEIAVSTEISSKLKLKENSNIDISLTSKSESIDLIYKKLKCVPLNRKELFKIIKDIVHNALNEAEIAYFVSSIYKCGMSIKEIKYLTEAIASTGKKLNLRKGIIADKHSIGGIPGKTTPIIVSICASTGLIIPKTSSRAITTAAGTADALETLCKVELTVEEIKKVISKTNACMVWGGSLGLAPADDKIIEVEKLLNLDPEPQLLASIMAKKLAVGAKYIIIDIPYGKSAKVNKKQAFSLKRKFEKLARYFNIKLKCILNEAKEPIGNGIGPVLEMIDVIKVLKRENSCYLLEEKSTDLAAELLELTGKAKKGQGKRIATCLLDSGKAYEKFKQIIKAQKGKLNGLKLGKYKKDIYSEKNFKIKEIDNKKVNYIAIAAGCPIDKGAGLYLWKHINDKVKKDEKIVTIYSESQNKLDDALLLYKKLAPVA